MPAGFGLSRIGVTRHQSNFFFVPALESSFANSIRYGEQKIRKRSQVFRACRPRRDVGVAAARAGRSREVGGTGEGFPFRYFGTHGFDLLADQLERVIAQLEPDRFRSRGHRGEQGVRSFRRIARLLAALGLTGRPDHVHHGVVIAEGAGRTVHRAARPMDPRAPRPGRGRSDNWPPWPALRRCLPVRTCGRSNR